MKTLSAEDLKGYELKSSNFDKTPKADAFYKEICSLPVGWSVLIEKSEWPMKTQPYGANIPSRYKTIDYAKYRTASLLDGTGWVVTRVE